MQELTKAEEQVMKCLWKLEKAFLKEIVEAFDEPKPAYTTISTVVRVLVKKGFIGFETFNKSNQYFPKISKASYFRGHMKGLVSRFLNGSHTRLASYFTEAEDISLQELEEIKKMIEDRIDQEKKGN